MDSQYIAELASQIILNIIYLGALAGLIYIKNIIQKYKAVLNSKLTESQRQLLEAIAKDTVIYIGKQWENSSGPEKFNLAVVHVMDSTKHYGLNLSLQDVQAAIEAAYQKSKQVNSNK